MNNMARLIAVACALGLQSPYVSATEYTGVFGDCSIDASCRLLSAAELDRLRGGFSFMSGSSELEVRIGISRAVFINDALVAVSQHLVLPTLEQLRDGTYVPSSAVMGTISAVSQPAAQTSSSSNSATQAAAAATPGTAGAATQAAAAPAGSAGSASAVSADSVRVNGVPVTASAPVIVSADEVRALVIQNGAANVAAPSTADIRANTMATILQNSLDNQSIRTLTTLSASTNALSAFRDAITREAIGQATTDFLR